MIEVLKSVTVCDYDRNYGTLIELKMNFVVDSSGSGEDQYYVYVTGFETYDSRSTKNWMLFDSLLTRSVWQKMLFDVKNQHVSK